MVLHEIGYLIIGGALQCWFLGAQTPCPNAEKIKPAGITRENSKDFEALEVHYEESGFAVFQRKNDTFEIRKKTGEKINIDLAELNRQTKDALPKKMAADDVNYSLWRYESIEEIFKNGMISKQTDFIPLLRKDDLKTPLNISKEQLASVRQSRIDKLLIEQQWSLPIGYILTSVPCTYKKIDANTQMGSCAPPGKATAYAKPDRNSEKVIEASLLWAHLEGRSVQTNKPNPSEHSEELLIFEEQGDWVRMKLVVLDKSKRIVWLNKKDIPYTIVHLNPADRMKTLIEFLNPPSVTSAQENRILAENLKLLANEPLDLDLDSSGETKWSDGVLWVKVTVRSEPHCSGEESKPIATGWLPYIDPKTKKKIIGWYSRGC
ncbi:MAG: hypothetical protein HUU56_02715 [Bdellovibrionaceae bacterium]|nr:hypothetical protein [Pseudobdellovibrionaceae bacterium]